MACPVSSTSLTRLYSLTSAALAEPSAPPCIPASAAVTLQIFIKRRRSIFSPGSIKKRGVAHPLFEILVLRKKIPLQGFCPGQRSAPLDLIAILEHLGIFGEREGFCFGIVGIRCIDGNTLQWFGIDQRETDCLRAIPLNVLALSTRGEHLRHILSLCVGGIGALGVRMRT